MANRSSGEFNSPSNLYLVFTICFLGGVFGGVTSTLMSSYLPVAVKELLNGTDSSQNDRISAIINAVYLFGMMMGGLVLGIFGDYKGRKISSIVSIACIGLFTALTSMAHSWEVLTVFRFLTGFGVGGVLVSTTILIDEIWPEKNKAVALGILSITIPVGIFSAGLITYQIADWRQGFLIGIAPVLLAVVAQWILPESGKWKNSRVENGANSAVRISIFQKQTRRDLVIGTIIYGSMLIGLWAIFSWLPTWMQSLLPEGDGHKEIGTGMMLFAIGGLTGGFISGWLSNIFGMKKIMVLCFAGTFIFSCLLFRFQTSITVFSYIDMAGIALFFGISQGVLNVYIPELFPVVIRSAATGFCFNAGRIFTASAVFFVGWMVQFLNGYGNALFIFSFIFFVGLVATFFARDNKTVTR